MQHDPVTTKITELAGVKFEELDAFGLEELLFLKLAPRHAHYKDLAKEVETIAETIRAESLKSGATHLDTPNQKLLSRLLKWQTERVKIVFLTARSEFLRTETEARLRSLGFQNPVVLMAGEKVSSISKFKVEKAREFLAAHPRLNFLAFLDDKRLNVEAMKEAFPGLLALQILIQAPKTPSGELRSYILDRPQKHLQIFSPDCTFFDEAKPAQTPKVAAPRRKTQRKASAPQKPA
jgi:hypothetical protein